MSIQSIINFIDNKNYINDNEISFNNYFKGDINEYYENDKNLMNIFKEKYKNRCCCRTVVTSEYGLGGKLNSSNIRS